MTWHEDDDISSERNPKLEEAEKDDDGSTIKEKHGSACLCFSIGRRGAAAQQHPAGLGEVHHGAAGGAVLFP